MISAWRVYGCWHRQKWSRLAGLQNTSTHFKMEPHQIILFNLCQWLVHVCIWSRWWSRDVRNLKISPGVKEEEHCRGGNLPEQPGQGCWLRKHSTDGLLPKPLLQWTALFIKCRVLTTKADKKANNILWKTIFCWFGKCSAEDNQQTGYFFQTTFLRQHTSKSLKVYKLLSILKPQNSLPCALQEKY